jgi:hypothetical protein
VHRPIEHLCQRELGLQDREVVAAAGLAISGGKGVWQPAQPFAQQPVDLVGGQAVADLLQALGIGAALRAIVGNA